MYLCTFFLDFGNRTFAKNFMILWCWGRSLACYGAMVLPRNSTSVTPKWHLSMDSLSPACLMHSKTARMFRISCVTELAAIPMSSTYCAHWSALITFSRYSLMKLENASKPCSVLVLNACRRTSYLRS